MKLLVDECVDVRVAQLLAERGYEAVHVASMTELRATEDLAIIKLAQANGQVVVTTNWKDYAPLFKRQPDDNVTLFRNAGLITLHGPEKQHVVRVGQALDLIAFEHTRRQAMRDRRLVVEIHDIKTIVW